MQDKLPPRKCRWKSFAGVAIQRVSRSIPLLIFPLEGIIARARSKALALAWKSPGPVIISTCGMLGPAE